ncbi:rod shape-determining protein MreD [Neotamlana laminarinivorans]|uniref:Rod shape-determining protein MreD n=1 Tax=Neotamlana laminarinivorans TaxID=2883124 RepID=A0A9X1L2L7_9FLAO|nr:rod shape-determining protein MreD [Tamlana laminarinivorans]MCB4799903.1 rod shape-determining protein MreD [Tamlana laminarinivorans]
MNNLFSIYTIHFFALVLVQVLIFNNINFLGYINPYPYILFVALFPVKNNRLALIFISFLLGLSIDLFLDTGGIHAAASVTIAYLRPIFLKFAFGTIYEHQTVKFNSVDFGSKLVYFTLLAAVHHLVLFSLELFNISKIILILQKALFSSIFTILISISITIVFSRKTR